MLLVFSIVDLLRSIELFIGGAIGVGFSIFIIGSIGITEAILAPVIVIVVIWLISNDKILAQK